MRVFVRKNNKGQKIWYIDINIDGKRLRKSAGLVKREAEEELARLREKYRQGEDVFKKPENPKFNEFAKDF